MTPQPSAPIDVQLATPTPVKLFQSPPTPIRPTKESNKEAREALIIPKATKAKSTPVKHVPRRSIRHRSAPLRLGYIAEFDGRSLEWLNNIAAECPLPPPLSYKASVSDPGTLLELQ